MPKLLEVIVSSLEDALEAQAGGADRLEILESAESGGLTPSCDLVSSIRDGVSIPFRVMVRRNDLMSIQSQEELSSVTEDASRFERLGVNALVMGFVRDGQIDIETLERILSAAPSCKFTFHRAFEDLVDPIAGINQLKRFAQIDRILVRAPASGSGAGLERLLQWQRVAAPEIVIIAGTGMSESTLSALCHYEELREVHVGRLARIPPEASGAVSRKRVSSIKTQLG